MERWSGKVAVVTGASAGIGAAIVVALLKADCIVVGLARRIECIEELRKQVSAVQSKNLHAIKCDVTVDADITAAFEWIERHLDGVDILINNAGTPPAGNLVDAGNTAKIRNILETNVMGVVQCTREAFQSMKRRGVDGHVVLMNSICGHSVPYIPGAGSLSIYVPSKYAITGMTEILRQEFHNLKTRVKISVRLAVFVCYKTRH